MAASTYTPTHAPTVSSHFNINFRPDIRGDAQALDTIFHQADVGRPFFYACDDPNMVGFIYTDKRGLTTQKHFHVKSHFTSEIVSVDMLRSLGLAAEPTDTLPHLFAKYYVGRFPAPPYFRPSTDPNAISLTFIQANGTRGDLRLHFYMGENDSPVLVTAADLNHIYSSSYDRYYWNPTEPLADPIATS